MYYVPVLINISYNQFWSIYDALGNKLYSAFHKTFGKWFLKLIWKSQFHYVVVNQIMNFKTRLLYAFIFPLKYSNLMLHFFH